MSKLLFLVCLLLSVKCFSNFFDTALNGLLISSLFLSKGGLVLNRRLLQSLIFSEKMQFLSFQFHRFLTMTTRIFGEFGITEGFLSMETNSNFEEIETRICKGKYRGYVRKSQGK